MDVQTLSRSPKAMSIDEFFDWLDAKDEKYELVEGIAVSQPWVKRNHANIVSNVSYLLIAQVNRDEYRVYQGDFAIPTGPRSIRYADVMVEAAGGSGHGRTTETAVVVFEVLSPSTATEDFGPKQREYLTLPTLADYLIVAQDSRCVWQWTREENGGWPAKPSIVEDGAVELTRLGASLPLEEIYRNVS